MELDNPKVKASTARNSCSVTVVVVMVVIRGMRGHPLFIPPKAINKWVSDILLFYYIPCIGVEAYKPEQGKEVVEKTAGEPVDFYTLLWIFERLIQLYNAELKPVPAQPSSGGGGGMQPNTQPANIKQKICSAIPSGRTIGVAGGIGGVSSVEGAGELVVNYNSGQVSAFGFGGVQTGWNGGMSGSVYAGLIYGLKVSNSNYSGGFTSINGGMGPGGFLASSSGGLTNGLGGLTPDGKVKAGGLSFGAGLLGSASFGAAATNYTKPFQLGKWLGFSPIDMLLYSARQLCK